MTEDLKLTGKVREIARPGGVGFQVTTEVLFLPHPEFAALECDREVLRKDMAQAFLEVLQAKIPEMAEATGYVVHDLQVGIQVMLMDEVEDSEPSGD